MNIAIVDDEQACRKKLKSLLEKWGEQNAIPVDTESYKNGDTLLNADFMQYDLVFLDIDMPSINGMELAKLLRKKGYTKYIIFLTAHNEYVFEGYHVRALDYLLKPITQEVLDTGLYPIIEEYKSSSYTLEVDGEKKRIPFSSIITFRSEGHYVLISTATEEYRQRITLKELLPLLPDSFIQCHRTLLVNINHVTKINGSNLLLTNEKTASISRTHLKKIQNAFMNCIL